MNPIYEFGLQIIAWLQTTSPLLDGLMRFFTFLGSVEFYLILIPILYWVVSTSLGFRVLLLLLGTDFLGICLKQLLHQPRPYWIGNVKPLATETSYGIPSTHSSDSIAVWGYLAYKLDKSWLWALSVILVLLIGLSRLYLGVHFPTDVLGGWILGMLGIFLLVKGEVWLTPFLKRQTTGGLIGIGFAVSVLMVLAGWLINLLIAASPDPAEWAQYSTTARGITHYLRLAGAFFGLVAGYTLMQKYAPFETKGSWAQRIGRYLLGIAGLLVIYLGLDLLFGLIAYDATALGLVLRYIRHGTVTFWVMFAAPWVFLKLRLAEPGRKVAQDERLIERDQLPAAPRL